jgi:glycosyltransferase 2 family protein
LTRLGDAPRWKFILAAYGRSAFDVLALGLCFTLFHHPIPIGTLFVGYGLTLMLSGMASLPGGVGIADASIPIIFAGLGVPGAVALAAGLTYRLMAYWLVRFVGFVSWQVLESGK